MKKYTLTTLTGEKINDCRNCGEKVANAAFDAMVNDDVVQIVEDGFTVPNALTETELTAVNENLATEGLRAIPQD